jgi:hypothetical protein
LPHLTTLIPNPFGWLQFGDTSGVYLYLSQKASAAKEKWLYIVNFVLNLMVDFVNRSIKQQHGPNVDDQELLRKRAFGVVVSSASNPFEGNFGWHQDGKNGIVDEGDPRYSSAQLTATTLCLQNYAYSNTRIEWAPIAEPTFKACTVIQECILFHIQLLHVNEKFFCYSSKDPHLLFFSPRHLHPLSHPSHCIFFTLEFRL